MILFSLSTIAYAGEPAVLEWAIISPVEDACYAVYDYAIGYPSIGGATGECTNYIKVVINENKVTATCRFTDISQGYEANADIGKILYCVLQSEDGTYVGGTGSIVAAANHGDETGGSVKLMCTFDPDDCIDCY